MEIARAGLWEWDIASGLVQLSDILHSITGIPQDGRQLHYQDMLGAVHPQDQAAAAARLQAALQQHREFDIEVRMLRPDGQMFWIGLRAAAEYDEHGTPLRMIGVATDVTERREAEIALLRSEERFRTMVETTATIVWLADPQGALKDISPTFEQHTGRKVEEGLKDGWAADLHPDDFERTVAVWGAAAASGQPLYNEFRLRTAQGGYRHFSAQAAPLRGADGAIREWIGICTDIEERKQAEARLEHLHQQLADSFRSAGMAEVATNVLHNVGNVLNSVNISAGLVAERVARSKIPGLARTVALLREHQADLAAFVGTNPKGKLVPEYLARLSEHLQAEQAEMLKELDSLRANIDHIKKIVAMQQDYAKVSGVSERIDAIALVEDALRLNEASRSRHRIGMMREFQPVPPIWIDRHKALQILVNLLSNAMHACDDSGRSDKQITVRVAPAEAGVQIQVQDNGVGIPAENLTRIFNFGFTTRKHGHGFGLHSAALAAKELGGSLSAYSAGPGRGASFALELPQEAAGCTT